MKNKKIFTLWYKKIIIINLIVVLSFFYAFSQSGSLEYMGKNRNLITFSNNYENDEGSLTIKTAVNFPSDYFATAAHVEIKVLVITNYRTYEVAVVDKYYGSHHKMNGVPSRKIVEYEEGRTVYFTTNKQISEKEKVEQINLKLQFYANDKVITFALRQQAPPKKDETTSLADMKKNAGNIDVEILSIQETNFSVMDLGFNVKFPAKYFDKSAKMNIAPEIVCENGDVITSPDKFTVVGENKTQGTVIKYSEKTILNCNPSFAYSQEIKTLKIKATVTIKGEKVDFYIYDEPFNIKSNNNTSENNVVISEGNEAVIKNDVEATINNLPPNITETNNNIKIKYYTTEELQAKLDSLTNLLKVKKSENDAKSQAVIQAEMARINFKLNNFGLAYQHFSNAIRIKEETKDTANLVNLYSSIALISQSQNNPDLAISYLKKGIQIKEQSGSNKELAKLNNQLSGVYYEQKNYENTIKTYETIIQIEEENNNPEELSSSYNNLAIVYADNQEYKMSEFFLKKSENISKELPDNKKRSAIILNNAGNNLFYQSKYKKALEKYDASLKIKEEIADTNAIARTLFNIANTHNKLSNKDEALKNYEKSKALAQQVYNKELVDKNNYQIAELTSLKEECSNAVFYFKEYINSLNYNVNDFSKPIPEFIKKYLINDKINELEMQLDIVKNKALAFKKLLNTEEKLTEVLKKNAKSKNILITVLGSGLLIVLLLALLFLRELSLKKKAHIKLNEHFEIIKQQNEEILAQSEQLKQANEEISTINEDINSQKEELENTLDNLQKTQSQLVESEKMASLGQLITSIAHELNTPLGAINSSIYNVKEGLKFSLKNLPSLIKKISDEELKLMTNLLETSLINTSHYTSREMRKLKRQIRKDLETKECQKAYFVADMLSEMEIFDNYEQFNKLFESKNIEPIMNATYNLSIQQKNSENITVAVGRASKIISALRNYSHQYDTDQLTDIDITKTIETVLTLYHSKTKHNITIVKKFEPIRNIKVFADELNQVWTNLLHNSIQAIEGKGKITIDVKEVDNYIKITLIDTGKGIPEEIKEKIFTPFFTTKAAGEGTGLGLDITRKIIEKHNGKIDFESELGKGTTFNVFLPIK